jgi:hypothetical protein
MPKLTIDFSRRPTQAQVEFAEAIESKLRISGPNYDSYDDVSDFITENKDEYYEACRDKDFD